MTTTRRLAAILAADVAGYSAAMERDEEGTAAAVRTLRREVIEPKLAEHNGRLIKTTGDGFLAEFASPIAALNCALAIQQRPDRGALQLRIGLNLGDVIIEEGGDVLGEGVNIAARLEALAEPGGILISSKVHGEVEGKVEAAFEDSGEQDVKNISKPVRAYAVRTGTQTSAALPATGKPLPLPDKPSIAVLPFQNMSGDPEQEYFADGMVEEIITALSRFRQLFVIARNSSFTYKGKGVDIKQAGRELGVRYVLEGSVRKAGRRVRVAAQLIEAQTDVHLWADKFDGALDDVFELQDQVATQVVSAIAPKVINAEVERGSRKPVESWNAYDHFLKGRSLHQQRTPEATRQAILQYSKAVEIDPHFGAAFAWSALAVHTLRDHLLQPITEAERHAAIERAERAVSLSADNSSVLSVTANVFAFLKADLDYAQVVADRALTLNANNAGAWNVMGWISLFLGQHRRALECFASAIRLNPVDPAVTPVLLQGSGFACGLMQRPDDALVWTRKLLAIRPDNLIGLAQMAIYFAQLGSTDDARGAAEKFRQAFPNLRASGLKQLWCKYYRRSEDRQAIEAHIDVLGLPE